MRYRTLGRTGLKVSEVGFGGWGIGKTSWIGADDNASRQALSAAREQGINFFDTAPSYGRGHSERLLGEMFGNSPDVVISSKVPPKNRQWPPQRGVPLREVYPREYVLESVGRTLENLRRPVLEIFQFHVWSDAWAGDSEWYDTLAEIRERKLARFIGISVNDHQPTNVMKALDTGFVHTVQVIYNIFDQSAEDELFPYCIQKNTGVISRVPFDEGALAGAVTPGTRFPDGDFRNQYFQGPRRKKVWRRIEALLSDMAIPSDHLPCLALRFCLAHPAVSTVIAGMRTTAHVQKNAQCSTEVPLSEQALQKLKQHRWVRNYYLPLGWKEKLAGLAGLAG